MIEFKFLLDENVSHAVRSTVRRTLHEVVVWSVGEPGAPPRGTVDPTILEWCERHGYILVTNNRASVPVHLAEHLAVGRHSPGIFVVSPAMGIGEIAAELALIVAASAPEEFRDALTYLPLSE